MKYIVLETNLDKLQHPKEMKPDSFDTFLSLEVLLAMKGTLNLLYISPRLLCNSCTLMKNYFLFNYCD